MAERAYITPEVLIWARETANISILEAANHVPCKVEKIIEWEEGQSYPTINQAMKLANKYRRPFAAFFLPEPPKDFQLISDFRRKSNKGEYSTALIFTIREIQEKQAWISEILRDSGEEPLPFVGRFRRSSPPKEVAKDIISELSIDDSLSSPGIKYWVERVESRGIFVSQFGSYHSHLAIKVNEARGFAISDPYAPFVYVNSRDYPPAQLFTLVHELVHIWISASGVSDAQFVEFREHRSEYDETEFFCNQVVAEVLMPEEQIISDFHGMTTISHQLVREMAQGYGVSPLALWTRLLLLNFISYAQYKGVKKMTSMRQPVVEKKKPTGGNYYATRAKRHGKAFSHVVIDSYRSGTISGTQASSLLGVKINKFNEFATYLN